MDAPDVHPKVFSLSGAALKLNSAHDIETYLKTVDPTFIEEIDMSGNTLGIGAAEELGGYIGRTALKVCGQRVWCGVELTVLFFFLGHQSFRFVYRSSLL